VGLIILYIALHYITVFIVAYSEKKLIGTTMAQKQSAETGESSVYVETLATIELCAVQRGRAVPEHRNRFDGTSNISVAANTQVGSISAGAASPAGRHASHNGQRRHILRSALPLHLYFQVFLLSLSVFPNTSFYFG